MSKLSTNSGLEIITRPKKVEAFLWWRLRYNREELCREELFKLHQAFAKKLAKQQYYRRPQYGLELSDFEQLAYTGLLQAIDCYDPLLNIPFEAYARHRIIGSIADGALKSNEKGAQYSYQSKIETERIQSLRTLGGNDNQDALTQLSELAVGLAIGYMLEDTMVQAVEDAPDTKPNAYETLSWRELQKSLLKAITKLPNPEDIVVKNHYIEGVAFVQIAQLLKITKGRVSQIHKSALLRLRKLMRSFY